MLATEARRVFKDSAVIFAVLAAIFAGIAGTDQDIYLAPALEIFLLLYAAFTGWSLFERERQENAAEYMLSLPLSRGRLLLLKFLPRLLAASLLLLLYLHLHRTWQFPSFLSRTDFAVLYGGFFLLAIAFSISFKNFISAFFTVCLLDIGQVLLIKLLDSGRDIGPTILQANASVLLFPLMFLLLFQRYDIKPVSYFNKRFFPGLLLLAGLITGFILLNTPDNWNNYTLTSRGRIIKRSCRRSELTLGRERHRFQGCLTVLRETEDGKSLYCLIREARKDAPCISKDLAVLDLETGALKPFFRFPEGWSVCEGYPGEMGTIRDGAYSVFLQNALLKQSMILEFRDGRVERFPVRGEFYDPDIRYVYYLDGQPRQLLVFSDPRLYRLDISGQVKELADIRSFSVWQDKALLFDASGVSLYRLGEELTLLLQEKGNYKKSARRLGGYESRSVVYHAGRDYFWLDMERQKVSRLEAKSPPYTYQQSGDAFNIVFANGSVFTISEIRSEKQSERVWGPGFKPAGIRISPFGLLFFNDRGYKVYPFNK